jgi:hypothetical protein
MAGCMYKAAEEVLALLGLFETDLPAIDRARVDAVREASRPRAQAPPARSPEPTSQQRSPVLLDLLGVTPRAVSWLWAGRIPLGKITILDGDPDVGKSTITLDLAARVSTGAPMPDGTPGVSGGVVLLSAEDDAADTIVPRLNAACADLSRIRLLQGVKDERGETRLAVLPADLDSLEWAIHETEAVLVVVDPLMAVLDAKTNAHRDQDVRRALAPLARLSERLGVALLVVRHLNKSGGGHALYRGGGSIGIIGAARSGLLAARDPDDESRRVLAVTKANLAGRAQSLAYSLVKDGDTVRVEWLGASAHSASSLLAVPLDDDERSALEAAIDFLASELRDRPAAPKDLQLRARAAGIADATLRRAKERLGVVARKTGMRDGWVWQLPSPVLAPKVLNGSEGAQALVMSTFEEDERLRGPSEPNQRGETEEHML